MSYLLINCDVPNMSHTAAYPLCTITVKAVVRALTQFMSIFGVPGVIQSDQGSNFSPHLFSQILKQLRIKCNQASAYHARSQGVLEIAQGSAPMTWDWDGIWACGGTSAGQLE